MICMLCLVSGGYHNLGVLNFNGERVTREAGQYCIGTRPFWSSAACPSTSSMTKKQLQRL